MGDQVSDGQEVCFCGRPVQKEKEMILIALNKPAGIVCTAEKREKNNVIDFLHYPKRIYPVGRLDKESEGLLLLTNNGEIVNKIMRSGNMHEKEYLVTVNRPVTDVVGITMPCFGTTDRTYNNSLELMKTLGVTSVTIPIADAVEQHFRDIGHDKAVTDLTFENSQARERTQVLMDYAGKVGGLVVGTGDLSELALGWCTYNADHMSMYGVNASIPKTLIRWMIDALVEYEIFPDSTAVLRDVLDTPISPELLPPDENGKIAQQTESIVGPYALHDFFLYYVLRFGFAPEKIYDLACRAFSGDFDGETIKKWLKNFYRRFVTQQFKRSCLPDGVKVGSVCLSPRGDWRMPGDASASLWLQAAEKL